jgi:predicted TIM-barrel fold metal-dependent hydrolase
MKMVEFAAEVLPERILFGTDFPFNIDQTQRTVLDSLQQLDLSAELREAILWRNAAALLGLEPRESG